jgi:hypothetical protein
MTGSNTQICQGIEEAAGDANKVGRVRLGIDECTFEAVACLAEQASVLLVMERLRQVGGAVGEVSELVGGYLGGGERFTQFLDQLRERSLGRDIEGTRPPQRVCDIAQPGLKLRDRRRL